MIVEIHSLTELEHYVATRGSLDGAVVQGLDLSESFTLSGVSCRGAVFLGCKIVTEDHGRILAEGGLVFPPLPGLPYGPYRPTLYSVEELMDGYQPGDHQTRSSTVDARIYRHYHAAKKDGPAAIMEALAQRLHDHAIDNALDELIHADPPAKLVAIMGGHAMARDEPSYLDVARIGRGLARRGFLVTTGGGPGAMEAAHLGAWMATYDDAALHSAVDELSHAPSYRDPAWFDTALAVRKRFPSTQPSLGIPTWFYGHEPPNLFASAIAKYFSNSLREDGLLAIAKHGVIYAPGSAGTIQEIFMDAAQNHYGTFIDVSPMVFFKEAYWCETKPVFPLLRSLAKGRQYGDLLAVHDAPDDVVRFIEDHPPRPYSSSD